MIIVLLMRARTRNITSQVFQHRDLAGTQILSSNGTTPHGKAHGGGSEASQQFVIGISCKGSTSSSTAWVITKEGTFMKGSIPRKKSSCPSHGTGLTMVGSRSWQFWAEC